MTPTLDKAFLRLSTLPGEQGQVDWGHFGKIRVGKAERSLMAFVTDAGDPFGRARPSLALAAPRSP